MIRLVVVVFALILAPEGIQATTYATQEQIDRHQAKLASWDSLDGVWDGIVSFTPATNQPPSPTWKVRLIVSGKTAVLSMRHVSNGSVIELSPAVLSMDPKMGVFFDTAVTTPRYKGKFEFALLRQERDDAVVSITIWHPPPTGPAALQEVSYWHGSATRRRDSRSQGSSGER